MAEERASSADRRVGRWSAFDTALGLHCSVAVSLFVYALVASVAGSVFVNSLFALAVLQTLIAIPGICADIFQSARFIVVYAVLQLFTGICELIWAVNLLLIAENATTKETLGYVLLAAAIFQFVAAVVAIWRHPLPLLRDAHHKHKNVILVRRRVDLQSPASSCQFSTSTQTQLEDDREPNSADKSPESCPRCLMPSDSLSMHQDTMSTQASPLSSASWVNVASSPKSDSETEVFMRNVVDETSSKSVVQLETAISPEKRTVRSPIELTARSSTELTARLTSTSTETSDAPYTPLSPSSSVNSDWETKSSMHSATTATGTLPYTMHSSTDFSAPLASVYCVSTDPNDVHASTSIEPTGHIASTVDSDYCSPSLNTGRQLGTGRR